MTRVIHGLFSMAVLIVIGLNSALANGLQAGAPQSFVFTDVGYFADKPLAVHYYKATSAGSDAKILFAIHGVQHDGAQARNNWVEWAEKNQGIVLAPEFAPPHYPAKSFQWGGMEDADPQHWTFQLIEHLFDKMRRDEGLSAERYYIFGHSAGAQFVHRFVLMMDKPRVALAVAANAGSYTMPVYPDSSSGKGFPWFASEPRLPPSKLAAAFGRPLVVMLGEADTRTDGNLPKQSEAMAQGLDRLTRGRAFFQAAQEQSRNQNVVLRWQLQTIPGVGHSSSTMSKFAVRLFTSFTD
jgi:poly(3-hydroxybutyrate) depolymerase